MLTEINARKLHYRAHHRGTREADAIVGGFFDRHHSIWTADEVTWFEALLDEQDADIIGWAIGTILVPDAFAGPMITAMQQLDYIALPAGLEPNG